VRQAYCEEEIQPISLATFKFLMYLILDEQIFFHKRWVLSVFRMILKVIAWPIY